MSKDLTKEQKRALAEFVEALDAHQVACWTAGLSKIAETRQRVLASFTAQLTAERACSRPHVIDPHDD